ncbi:MAG: MFS transporter [Gammaproteobacteria bacterium]
MNPTERRTTAALAGVFALRMLGMFLVLPVFVLYADDLAGATPVLVGLALGIYGLTQGVLQIPFGLASDRWGRKPLLVSGLVIFAAGSAVAALAPDIGWTIAGRALQGAGAIAAVLTALLADQTRDEFRTRAMAVIGISIGASFAVSLLLGPVLGAVIGVRGIFWLTAGFAVAGIAVVLWLVPAEGHAAQRRRSDADAVPTDLSAVVSDRSLWPLFGGIFVLHFLLTALFVALPPAIEAFGIAHGRVYLPVLLGSVVLMLPAVLVADREPWRRWLLPVAVALVATALAGLAAAHSIFPALVVLLLMFFAGFNFLEAHLPAAVSRAATTERRGAALGVYSSCQFLGAFAGGLVGGAAYGAAGSMGGFAIGAAMAAVWLLGCLAGTQRRVPSRAA